MFKTRAENEADLLSISENDFLRLMSMFPKHYDEVKEEAIRREHCILYSLKKVHLIIF